MNKFKHIFKDFTVSRLWGIWARSYKTNNVFRKSRRERVVREVFHRFKQTFISPRGTLLLTATAAYKKVDDDHFPSCDKNITDEELEVYNILHIYYIIRSVV